uniref:Glycosyl hydrolase family 63 C-terminal domain-containing protein n=1 Tax=Brassica oleracea var. oleracea TaxID=109376 RepID=A0A0D3C8B3_BRAOL
MDSTVMCRPPTANGPPTSALSARGPHPVPTVRPLIFQGLESLFTDPAITTRPFPVLWPHSHAIANHFTIGHSSFHYSSSSTLNSRVLSGCAPEKVIHPSTTLDQTRLTLEFFQDVLRKSKIKHDHVQYPDVVNPPTLLLVLCDLIIGIDEKKFNDDESAEIVSFLERAFARLEAWFQWLYTSQKGKKEGSFYWRGRDSTTDQELNPRTVASGMDDYPRASHPSDDEMHVDLRCWIYLAADCMKFITTFLQRKKTEEDYSSIVHQLSDFDDLNKMHYDRDHKTYLDFGNHAEKVRLVIEFGRGIRVTDEEPELKKVPRVGYASLFPFMSKIIPPHSEILEQQLDLISSNELVCSDYGLLSLAKTSSLYMTPNALMNQPPCWRGPIWMNINYMILASLKHYSSVEGPYSDKARDIYVKLRNNLIRIPSENSEGFPRKEEIPRNYFPRTCFVGMSSE